MLLIEKHIPWQYPPGGLKKRKRIRQDPQEAVEQSSSVKFPIALR